MVKRVVILTAAAILLVAGFVLQPNDPYQHRQVIGVAEPNTNPPLIINKHLRRTARPQESFNFPIKPGKTGPVQPSYAGGMQYPFFCMTEDSGLGQPLVDNQLELGVPVYDKTNQLIGYSKDCSLPTKSNYLAKLSSGEVHALEQLKLEQQSQVQQLFRVEQGTINRFIYSIIMPISFDDIGQPNHSSLWNKKLIYQFAGGSGIGFRQGKARLHRLLERRAEQLEQGFAIVASTGNKTSYTYNMVLAEDTARRVKAQFTALYGKPQYTVGIGGSGGGLAQYLIGQNSTGVLDAAIPLYSYPDMVSQTLYGLDCDLFNSYYAYQSNQPEYWQDWKQRVHIEGLNADNGKPHGSAMLEPLNQLLTLRWPVYPQGNSECINGWFGLATFVHNPAQGFLREFFNDDVQTQTRWNYWEDMVNLYGRDEFGYANSTWGNEGVQYGLKALRSGHLSIERFIHLNWHIGSWKPAQEMKEEVIYSPTNHKRSTLWLTLWSRHNVTQATPDTPAKRRSSSKVAAEAAYRSGQVFIGEIDIPIIDVRHYLENELDMHHMSASFVSRLRIQQAKGHSKNHIIWVSDKDFNPIDQAFVVMDKWMEQVQLHPTKSVWDIKPDFIQDSCLDAQGQVMYQGEKVWDGEWNGKPNGPCTDKYKIYSNSRIQAGGPWQGSIFNCQLISVEQAVEQGIYGKLNITPYLAELKKTFPNGVCNYSAGDTSLPADL